MTEPLTTTKMGLMTTGGLGSPAADDKGGATTARTARLSSLVRPSLAIALAAVLLIVGGFIGMTKARPYFAERDRAQQGAAALAAGRQLAINFVTMDYRTFDSYAAQVLNGATGSFHTDYAAKLADLKKVVVANRTRSSVKRVEAGLVSADLDSAEVIVGVVAPTSNTATPNVVDKTYRLHLNLQRTPDASAPWKVTSLDFVE